MILSNLNNLIRQIDIQIEVLLTKIKKEQTYYVNKKLYSTRTLHNLKPRLFQVIETTDLENFNEWIKRDAETYVLSKYEKINMSEVVK